MARTDILSAIKAKLAKYPSARYVETSTSIEVQPADENGFPVGMHVLDQEFVVHFSGWHEHFGSEEEALNCFMFGLSAGCRLCVVSHGPTPVKWIVEYQEGGAWVKESETRSIFVPFWRARTVTYLQNHLLQTPGQFSL